MGVFGGDFGDYFRAPWADSVLASMAVSRLCVQNN